jgi:hypothetical protein
MPNELTRLIDFDGILGDDVLMAINSATTLDDRRSAMLMGLRRALLRFYGLTSVVQTTLVHFVLDPDKIGYSPDKMGHIPDKIGHSSDKNYLYSKS